MGYPLQGVGLRSGTPGVNRFRDDAWLAGFTDGEGCFLITPKRAGYFAPRFRIALRVDDLGTLEALRAEFGGSLHTRLGRDAANPQADWQVNHRQDLAGLVGYFDRFPLRAKKALDYAIWRRAVSIFCAHGGRALELQALKQALEVGRTYDGEGVGEIEPFDQSQLRLVS